jgi:two-component sensor histidine kinase
LRRLREFAFLSTSVRFQKHMPWLQHLTRAALRTPSSFDWVLVLALFVAVTAARQLVVDQLPTIPFLLYLPAITLVTLAFGWRLGLVFLLATVAFVSLFWSDPFWVAGMQKHQRGVAMSLFVAVALLDVSVTEAVRRLLRAAASQREQVEALLRRQSALVAQQDVTFREMQHRIANNLQYVSNMLSLSQVEVDRGVDARDVLNKALARLTAMAQLHRKLHDIASYKDGVQQILQATLTEILDPDVVTIRLRIHPAPLSTEQMTALVLFVTEAATNAEKHVFRHGTGTVFEVLLEPVGDGRLRLTVHDDGPGLPVRACKPPVAEAAPEVQGLGLRIMHGLARQLGGPLEICTGAHSEMRVDFAPS